MTSRDPHMHLADVLAAADEITFFTLGFDEAMYLGESKTQSAVEPQFLIVGEG